MSSASHAIPSSTIHPTGWAGGSKLSHERSPFASTRHRRPPRPQGPGIDAEVAPRMAGAGIPRGGK